jgi:hypothetical protein
MSVKVGFLNDKYTFDNLNTKNNILRLNSFNDSNIILLNHDLNSTKDVFLNFKDVISSGFSSNTYCFRDIPGDNSNIMTINSCNISLDKPVFIQEELYISDVFSTSNGTIKLTSNTEIHLMSPIDSFSVFSSNDASKILFQTNDFAVNDVDNTSRIQITHNQIDINSNLYISNGTLFVDKISSIGTSLSIENASYTSTEFESLISINSFNLKNSPDSTDKEAFTIYKNYGNTNIVSINTCNILESTVSNNFTIDNNGLIGIGTEIPTASIDIRHINDNIMLYDGERTGDLFKITREGDIGIGTSLPKAQLHIKRNDDSIHPDNDDNRRNPLLLCDIAYDDSLNTSNVYVSVERQLIYTEASVKRTNMKLYLYNSVIDDDIQSGGKLVTLTYYLLNDDILNEAVDVPDESKLSAIIDENYLRFNGNFQQFETESGYTVNGSSGVIRIKSIIKYPSNYLSGLTAAQIQFTLDTPSQSADTLTITTHMTINHSANDADYGSTFHLHEPGFEIQVQDGVNLILQYTAQIHNEVGTYNVKYDVINNVQIPCPNFMHMLYNDTFISSLSASGALSLGEEMPVLSNHLLYVKGSSLIDELDVRNIYTNDVTCNISFLNTNLTNINTLQCTLCDSHEILAHAISNVFDIYSSNGVFSNLMASNFTFEHCKNNFLSFAEENIHLNTRVTIGDAPIDLTDYNTEIQINISDRVNASYFIQENLFNRNIGMSVSSLSSSINPCISVNSLSTDAIPSININNNERSYNFRIKKNQDETHFQLTSDNVYNRNYYDSSGASEILVPSIIQHTSSTKETIDYSVLTFGEQNIMNIDCKNKAEYNFDGTNTFQYNNYSSKITMGIPYAKTSVSDKNFVSDIFASSQIQNREYLLNVFGNVSISDICDYPMLTMKSSEIVVDNTKSQRDRQIYVAINGDPNNTHNLCVHGDIACDTIYVKNKDGTLIDLIDTIKTSVDWVAFKGNFV